MTRIKKNPHVPWSDYMRLWATDMKVSCLITMSPYRFLYLTTLDGLNQHDIEQHAHPVEDYAGWIESGDSGIPVFLKVALIGNGKGTISSHEGRHRAAAMAKSGETSIPVCIILADEDGYADRKLNAGDLPRWWLPQFRGTRKMQHITDVVQDIIVPAVQDTGIKKADVEKYGLVTPVRENPPRSCKFIRLYSHKYMAYIDYRKHPTRKGYVTRQRFEGDGFHWGPVTGKKVIKGTTASKEIRKLEATRYWKITRANPGEIIRPGPTFFRDRAVMRQVQEEVYERTGRWFSPAQINEFLLSAAAKKRREVIRVVK